MNLNTFYQTCSKSTIIMTSNLFWTLFIVVFATTYVVRVYPLGEHFGPS